MIARRRELQQKLLEAAPQLTALAASTAELKGFQESQLSAIFSNRSFHVVGVNA